MSDEIRCSFCEKPVSETPRIIAGTRGYICAECVSDCVAVLALEVAGLVKPVAPINLDTPELSEVLS